MHIRVYRITLVDGRLAYEQKETDGRGSMGCSSIFSLAHNARAAVERMLSEGCLHVSIDFSPFHDIDCYSDLAPRFCSPLSGEERAMFWTHFCAQ